MALAEDQGFKWPDSPERHDDGKTFVLANDTHVQLQLQLQVVAKQARMFPGTILAERHELAGRKIWQRSIRPDLAVRVRIAGAQQLAAIFENLHVINPGNLRQ